MPENTVSWQQSGSQLQLDSTVRSDSLFVCQHRLTLFSSARLRLSLARAGVPQATAGQHCPFLRGRKPSIPVRISGSLRLGAARTRRCVRRFEPTGPCRCFYKKDVYSDDRRHPGAGALSGSHRLQKCQCFDDSRARARVELFGTETGR